MDIISGISEFLYNDEAECYGQDPVYDKLSHADNEILDKLITLTSEELVNELIRVQEDRMAYIRLRCFLQGLRLGMAASNF